MENYPGKPPAFPEAHAPLADGDLAMEYKDLKSGQ